MGKRVSSSAELNFHGSSTVVVSMDIKGSDAVYTGRSSIKFHMNALSPVRLMTVSAAAASLAYPSTLKLEAVLSHETSTNY
jgi:hypothetical protein